jgi:glycosyltransferase EpsD
MKKTKLRVLFTATIDSHIQAFHIPYLKWFHDQGYEVHVATNGTEKIKYCDVKHTVSFARSPLKPSNIKAIGQLRRIINDNKFDIIHTHTPMGAAVTRVAARGARRRFKTCVIYTAHGFHFYRGAPKLNWLLYYPVEKLLSKSTDVLITINGEDYERARRKLRGPEVYKINGIGVDLGRFTTPKNKIYKDTIRKKYNIKSTDTVLIYAAELNANKNQMFLIDQMRYLTRKDPNIKLFLCGSGELKNQYLSAIHSANLENNIFLLGYREDIDDLFKASDVCVASSLREGLGLNLVEAMATGLPVIATKNRGHGEVLNPCKNKFMYDVNDQRKFRKYVLALCKNPSLRKKVGLENINRSHDFSLDTVMHEMEKIYNIQTDQSNLTL